MSFFVEEFKYKEEKEFLKNKYPDGVVFDSCDKDYISVRIVLCEKSKIDGMVVPLTKTMSFHVDTINLEILRNHL